MGKVWLYGIVCLCMCLSCARVASDESGEREICFRGNVLELQQVHLLGSRAGLGNGDKVQLYIVEQEGEELKLPASEDFYQMRSDADGNIDFEDGEKHVYPNNPINIYGFCCRGMEGNPADLLNVPVRVEGEQVSEEALLRSDFLYVKSEERYRATDNVISLNFSHQFVKLLFHFRTDTPETVDFGQITALEVLNVVREGSFDVATGELTLGDAVDDIQAQPASESMVIVLPQKVKGGDVLFRFVQDGKERSYSVPADGMSLEKGKLYTCDVLINQYPGAGDKDVVISTRVEDWDESEPPIYVVFEEGQNVVATLTDVSSGVVVKRADLYLSSENRNYEKLNIPVTRNKMEFMFPREKKGGTLQLNKARFYTEAGDEFDYYFQDKELLGDNLDELSLVSPKVGDAWGDGVIFAVGEVTGYDEASNSFVTNVDGINAYRGRIVANASLGSELWSETKSKGKASLIGASNRYDGLENLKTVEAFARDNGETLDLYPAFKVCKDLGENWYFPALNEIRWIVLHKEGLGLEMGTLSYGSSTEISVKDCGGVTKSGSDSLFDKAIMNIWPVRAY
ncbi:MAG: fimbrillin family protein [Sanguibacteroides justesenii]|nr:fimbrillin family protein [Sanguibacteroides justesenii]